MKVMEFWLSLRLVVLLLIHILHINMQLWIKLLIKHRYSWQGQNGTNSTSAILDNLQAGKYEVIVTDANGCTFTASVTLSCTPLSINVLNIITNITTVCSCAFGEVCTENNTCVCPSGTTCGNPNSMRPGQGGNGLTGGQLVAVLVAPIVGGIGIISAVGKHLFCCISRDWLIVVRIFLLFS
jgi:hypothetical protein